MPTHHGIVQEPADGLLGSVGYKNHGICSSDGLSDLGGQGNIRQEKC